MLFVADIASVNVSLKMQLYSGVRHPQMEIASKCQAGMHLKIAVALHFASNNIAKKTNCDI